MESVHIGTSFFYSFTNCPARCVIYQTSSLDYTYWETLFQVTLNPWYEVWRSSPFSFPKQRKTLCSDVNILGGMLLTPFFNTSSHSLKIEYTFKFDYCISWSFSITKEQLCGCLNKFRASLFWASFQKIVIFCTFWNFIVKTDLIATWLLLTYV